MLTKHILCYKIFLKIKTYQKGKGKGKDKGKGKVKVKVR